MRRLVVAAALIGCTAPARPPLARLPADLVLRDPQPFAAAARFHGRVVVLDFWARWCDACKRSVPALDRLAEAYPDVLVLGVDAGDPIDEAIRAAAELGIRYPLAFDPELAASDLFGGALPLVVVVDRDGTIAHRARQLDDETLAVIERLRATSSASAAGSSPASPR